MINNIYSALKATYNSVNLGHYDGIDPNLIRYFKTEYGKDWEGALNSYLHNKKRQNVKKAA
ncbi:MAG: hypothetical protein CMP16_02835 [Rickettsiales bacterium]|nr:hypothetical protein [Rickettsiales bacterium]|tara:strand:+ start:1220 stop:1402 length:183 start_codon:yes stop_codon:yes gene_type:complete